MFSHRVWIAPPRKARKYWEKEARSALTPALPLKLTWWLEIRWSQMILVGGLEHVFFPIYWECHHPNWRTPSFFRGIETTNQDNMNIYDISDQWQPGDIRALSYKKCSTKRSPRYVPRNCSAGTGPLRRLPWSLTRLPEYEGPRSW